MFLSSARMLYRARDLLGRRAGHSSTAQLAETYRLPYKLLASKERQSVAVADSQGTQYSTEVLVVSADAGTQLHVLAVHCICTMQKAATTKAGTSESAQAG